MIRVMIVDDQDLVSSAITALLSDTPNIEVIAKASSGEEAILLAKQHKPNVILMDIRMPGISGIFATQKITTQHPDIKIIALTSCNEAPFAIHMLKAGAHGYLTKGATIEKMVQAIRAVAAGTKFIDPSIAQTLALKNTAGTPSSIFEELSIREFNVVMMLSNGLSPKAIAEKLFISIKTLNSCRYNIYKKLNVKTDVELILLANQAGLIVEY
ncbi:MAG TPA: response regulator transcription factor [Gammaproteobacteria bacterium]|nr:response regulator transcription factor [Gammaproteobacteria bacterium]